VKKKKLCFSGNSIITFQCVWTPL